MYADMGIGVTVVRSGPYKALANPNEPLSKEGEAQLQSLVDATNAVFVSHVAAARNRTPEYVDGTMGQGREFVGAGAADVGLVDNITSFDALISSLQRRYIDTSLRGNDTQGNRGFGFRADTETEIQMSKQTTLTDEEIAALKAGGEQNVVGKQDTTSPDAKGSQEQDQKPANDGADEHATFAGALALVNKDLLDAKVANTQLTAELDKLKAVMPQMADVIAKSLSQMRIALGGVEVKAGDMSVEELLAAHTSTAADFTKKFPVGGVASVAPQAGGDKSDNSKLNAFMAASAAAAKRKR